MLPRRPSPKHAAPSGRVFADPQPLHVRRFWVPCPFFSALFFYRQGCTAASPLRRARISSAPIFNRLFSVYIFPHHFRLTNSLFIFENRTARVDTDAEEETAEIIPENLYIAGLLLSISVSLLFPPILC